MSSIYELDTSNNHKMFSTFETWVIFDKRLEEPSSMTHEELKISECADSSKSINEAKLCK